MFKRSWKLFPLFISINWPSLVTLWVVVLKIYSKMHPVLCTNTHHNVTDFVNYEMVKNRKTWISWEWNIKFLRNKKILNLSLIWHILRTYRFVTEVTFKGDLNLKRELNNFPSFKNFIIHYAWIILLGIKNKNLKYWSKTPDVFPNWLETPWLILNNFKRSLKKFKYF